MSQGQVVAVAFLAESRLQGGETVDPEVFPEERIVGIGQSEFLRLCFFLGLGYHEDIRQDD